MCKCLGVSLFLIFFWDQVFEVFWVVWVLEGVKNVLERDFAELFNFSLQISFAECCCFFFASSSFAHRVVLITDTVVMARYCVNR